MRSNLNGIIVITRNDPRRAERGKLANRPLPISAACPDLRQADTRGDDRRLKRNVNAAARKPNEDAESVPSGRSGRLRENTMNIEKYTQRARGLIQSGQSLASQTATSSFRRSICQSAARRRRGARPAVSIDRAGGTSRAILKATEDALGKLPKVSGSGAGQADLARNWRARSTRRKRRPRKPAIVSSRSNGCCWA